MTAKRERAGKRNKRKVTPQGLYFGWCERGVGSVGEAVGLAAFHVGQHCTMDRGQRRPFSLGTCGGRFEENAGEYTRVRIQVNTRESSMASNTQEHLARRAGLSNHKEMQTTRAHEARDSSLRLFQGKRDEIFQVQI